MVLAVMAMAAADSSVASRGVWWRIIIDATISRV